MLAYKSLILSILQRSFIFLLFVAALVATVVLFLLHRQGQKNFFSNRSSINLIYKPTKVRNHDQAPLSITNVFQIISANQVKSQAGELAKIPTEKQAFLGKGLEVSQDRNAGNTLTLTVTWDDTEEITALINAYANAARSEYAKHRKNDLSEQMKTLKKQKNSIEQEINNIDEETNKLTSKYSSSLDQELDKLQKRASRLEEELAGYIKQMVRLRKRQEDMKKGGKTIESRKAEIIKANYKYLMELMNKRDEALIHRNKVLEQFRPDHPDALGAEKELNERQTILDKVLENLGIIEEEVLTMDVNAIDIDGQVETLEQLITTTEEELADLQQKITTVRNLNQQVEKLLEQRSDKSNQIVDLEKKEADVYFLVEQSNNELPNLTVPRAPYPINGLGTKQYIVALFAGCVFAGFVAVIIILLAAQFGCISTATELHDMAEIEVFSLSESELKKLEPAALQEAAHNVFYVLNQIIEDRRYLFYGALQGSYSTALLFEQLLLQFAMNGTRIFILNLEPFDTNSEEDNGDDNSSSEDPIANDLLGVEKNSDIGVFRLGNASFISPNELDILKMDMETLLKHYDKIIFRRKAYFNGKELLFKQVISLTQCCLFSVGKKRSPRSFLKLLRDNKGTEENIIAGIFTEP